MYRTHSCLKYLGWLYEWLTPIADDVREPYTREEFLEEQFAALLKGLVLDDEIMGWVTEALRQSHSDAKQHHDAAIARLHAEYNRLQSRVDAMYVDKLDRRIEAAFWIARPPSGVASRSGCSNL